MADPRNRDAPARPPADPPITVVVVDDHDLLRQGVTTALSGFADLQVIGEARDGAGGVEIAAELRPDVVTMDLVMPMGGGVEAIRAINDRCPTVKVLALTSFSDGPLIRQALAAGATSYVMKNVDARALADAVRTTARGQSTLAPEVTRQLTMAPEIPGQAIIGGLTEREVEVAELVSAGLSNAEIAAELNRSLYTVKNHVSNVLMKLNAKSRTEAAAMMHRHRRLQPETGWPTEPPRWPGSSAEAGGTANPRR